MKIGAPPPHSGPPARGLPSRSAVRAEGFTELGMFGLSRYQIAPDFSFRPEAVAAAPPDPAPGRPTLDRTAPETPGAKASPIMAAEIAHAIGREAGTTFQTADSQKPASGLCIEPLEMAAGAAEDCCDGVSPAGGAPDRASSAPRTSAPSVILREKNGQAEVIVGTPDRDPASRLALRRLIETILARNGLALMQFQLNGALVAPDFQGKAGGPDGTRSN